MLIKDLITKLKQYSETAHIYINYEPNFEDDFNVVKADTDNILLVPIADFEELKSGQQFSFKED